MGTETSRSEPGLCWCFSKWQIKVRDKRDKSPYHVPACRCFADRERFCSKLSTGGLRQATTNEALAFPALKRVIRVETLSQSAKALLPPHKCGGSHHSASVPFVTRVSSGLGWPQARARWCSPSCQNCSIKSTHWAHPAYTVISALRRRALVGRRYAADRLDSSL